MFCDLHLHSDRSDGTVSPREVVRLARAADLAAMALTDHDTFAGVDEAMDEGRRVGVRVVPGVELSLEHRGTLHVIALGVDPDAPRLRTIVDRVRGGRDGRNRTIAENLNRLGIDVTLEEVEEEATGAVMGRPHFATVMVRKGLVRDSQEAFDLYLKKGASAYAERERPDRDDTLAAIAEAGGASVLCHPFTLGYRTSTPKGRTELRGFLEELTRGGLDAMEVRYGSYTRKQERFWQEMATDTGLLFSGGSDFHGTRKPGLRVGVGRGRMRVPVEWLDALLERAATRA